MKSIEEWYDETKKCIESQLGEGQKYVEFSYPEAKSRRIGVEICLELFKRKCKEYSDFNKFSERLEKYAKEIKIDGSTR